MEGSERAVKNYVHKLSFRVSDAVLSARFGLSARNIWAFWKGLTRAWLVWALFVYAGFYAAGDSMLERFSSSVLCPLPDELFFSSVPAIALLVLGTLLSVFILMTTSMKVGRLTFEQLRGDQFYSEGDAGKACMANWKPVLFTPLTILAGIAIGLFLLMLTGLLGKVPAAGPFFTALLTVPAWILGLFMILAGIALLLSFQLVPVITASTGGDTFENLFELFSTITSRPFRIVRGVIAGVFMRIPAFLLLVFFAWGSVQLTGGMIDRYSGSSGTSSAIESGFSRVAPDMVPFYSSIFSPVSSTSGGSVSWTGIPAWILAATGTALMIFLAAYWFSSCTAMWMIIYLGARYSRDGEDLLLRAEENEYREFRKVYGSTHLGGDRKSE